MLSSEIVQNLRVREAVGRPCLQRGVVLAAAVRRSGLRWLTALLDSHPRSVCRSEPLQHAYKASMPAALRRLGSTGILFAGERERLVDAWTSGTAEPAQTLFFSKNFTAKRPLQQWWNWLRSRWSRQPAGALHAATLPAAAEPYDLVLTQTASPDRIAALARGLKARLIVLRRHPGAVVASQLRGLRKGYLQPIDRVGWFEDNERACQQLELRLSSVLRLPQAELLSYQWLVHNMHLQTALAHAPLASVGLQFEDFCRQPAATAKRLFAFLGWELGPQTLDFIAQSTQAGWHSVRGWLAGRRRYETVFRHSASICDAWRLELTEYEQNRILSIAGSFPLFRKLWPE
jgi:Sulfotransferase family